MTNWLQSVSNWFSGYIKPSDRYKKHTVVVNNVQVSPVVRKSNEVSEVRPAIQAAEGYGQQRKQLYDIYHNVLLDEQVSECIERRLRAVCRGLTIMHNGQVLEDVKNLTQKSFFRKAIREVLNARFWGHTALELDWNTSGEGTTALVNRSHVKPRFGIVTVNNSDMTGYEYRKPPFSKNIVEAGEEEDLGLLVKCVIPALLRRMNFSDWSEFAETMGIPIKVGKYNDESARLILEETFANMGAAAHIVMPNDAEIEIHNPINVGTNSQIFDALHTACTNSISIALLGNSMTTNEAQHGGYAQGKVQQEGELDVFEDDQYYELAWLHETLTPYLRRIGYNIPEGSTWVYEQEERMGKLDKLKVLETLTRNGVPVGLTTWYETAGVPMPGADDLPPEQEEDDEEEVDKPKSTK
jgi:hypothetical protein